MDYIIVDKPLDSFAIEAILGLIDWGFINVLVHLEHRRTKVLPSGIRPTDQDLIRSDPGQLCVNWKCP